MRPEELIARIEAIVSDAEPADEPTVVNHSEWTCEACGVRIGMVDVADGTIRRKYRDDMSYVTLGEGGKITVPCRRCVQPNTITFDDVVALQRAVQGQNRSITG